MSSMGKLARTTVFLGQDQLGQLRFISDESGVPVAVMVRRGIQLYLDAVTAGSVPRWWPYGKNPGPDDVQAEAGSSATCPPSYS